MSTVLPTKTVKSAARTLYAGRVLQILMYRLCLCIDQRDFGRMNIALMEAIEINDGERLWDVANMPAAERNGIWPALAALQLAIAHEEVPVAKQLLGLVSPAVPIPAQGSGRATRSMTGDTPHSVMCLLWRGYLFRDGVICSMTRIYAP